MSAAPKPHSDQLATRWMLLKAHVEEHGTHLEVLHELLERVVELEEQLEASRRALWKAGDLLFGTWDDDQERSRAMRETEALIRAVLEASERGTPAGSDGTDSGTPDNGSAERLSRPATPRSEASGYTDADWQGEGPEPPWASERRPT